MRRSAGGAAGAGDCPGGSSPAPYGGAAAAWGGPSWFLLFWGSLEEWGWRMGVKSSLAGMGPAAGAMLWGAEGCCGVPWGAAGCAHQPGLLLSLAGGTRRTLDPARSIYGIKQS